MKEIDDDEAVSPSPLPLKRVNKTEPHRIHNSGASRLPPRPKGSSSGPSWTPGLAASSAAFAAVLAARVATPVRKASRKTSWYLCCFRWAPLATRSSTASSKRRGLVKRNCLTGCMPSLKRCMRPRCAADLAPRQDWVRPTNRFVAWHPHFCGRIRARPSTRCMASRRNVRDQRCYGGFKL